MVALSKFCLQIDADLDICYSTNHPEPSSRVLLTTLTNTSYPAYKSTSELSEPTLSLPQQASTAQTRGKGKRVPQPLPNIPRKREASNIILRTSAPGSQGQYRATAASVQRKHSSLYHYVEPIGRTKRCLFSGQPTLDALTLAHPHSKVWQSCARMAVLKALV
jgi:hypothetical protein